MKKMKLITLLTAMCVSFSAWALSLDEAKNQGLVGERNSGYLGLVVDNAEAKKVVNEINAKRKAQYLKLAEKNGLTLPQVEALAATKAFQKTQNGHYIESNGQWIKK
ncbi:YdbL family protein [Marinomonas sp. 15G1-11]|uniref:YdbL family protein n=1 Tax=Marinomonas phaeophyticola TaxID=3004091 RepID=A0ABT4JXJ7_9GAMM|nr:YdbL family protein [Marinomonas sp. 15G1-11]MCZ2722998.1 YdbL family protein [Marinomonas sp. 15G1-11]